LGRYILKKTPADKIIDAIREVRAGGAAMTPSTAMKVLEMFRQPKPNEFSLTDKKKKCCCG
jgi:DNA-binding NarL/FixJ family response regulator